MDITDISSLGFILQEFFEVQSQIYVHNNIHTDINYLLLTSNIRETHFRSVWSEDWIHNYTARDFHYLFRMSQDTFEKLVTALSTNSELIKSYNGGNKPISFPTKILISLWYFGREISMHSIGDRFNVSKSTVYNIVQEVTNCLCTNMARQFIRWPNIQECVIIEDEFKMKANMPGN